MNELKSSENFTYWKKPWQKWFIFNAAVLNLFALLHNIQEYRNIAMLGILSPSEFASYSASKYMQCASNGFIAASFFAIFVIGFIAKSKKSARLAEGIVLLVLAAAWVIAGITFDILTTNGQRFYFGFVLILALGGAAHSFYTSHKI